MKQTRAFRVNITKADKADLMELARMKGEPYGIFFDTSGRVHSEPINPTAQYSYLWRTDEETAKPGGYIMEILSNGSHWAGEKESPIEDLFKVLETHPLDRRWEATSPFIQTDPEWIEPYPGSTGHLTRYRTSSNPYPGHKVTIFCGNFLTISHGFRIHTDDPGLIEKLTKAIEANMQRPDYLKQEKPTPITNCTL